MVTPGTSLSKKAGEEGLRNTVPLRKRAFLVGFGSPCSRWGYTRLVPLVLERF